MNKLFLKNTATKKKEEFKPLENGKVKFYHCGPTVYWTQHIGNIRGVFIADILVRTLNYIGYNVVYVRNYTDVGHLTSDEDEGEDKIEKGAKREGLSPEEIANKYIKIFEEDVKRLNILKPNYKPRATNHIQEMIDMIQILLDKGYAYQTDLAIYYDTSKFVDYGELSGQKQRDKKSGAGSGNIADSDKKNPADFALWFFKAGVHKNAIQHWPSPFKSVLVENGEGFPGWHIECSSMSKKYLGNTLDIHLGGIEHIPVHHTNEIAQSEAANKVKFVNYWLHNGHLLVNDRKMSKSEGTGYSVSEVVEKGFNPLALRYFFLQAHYRSKQNFTWEVMHQAQSGYEHLLNQVRNLGKEKGEIDTKFKDKFLKYLLDDLNTPRALSVVQELLKSNLDKKDKLTTILDFDKVLGLDFKKEIKIISNIPEKVELLIKERQIARSNKNYKESDRLREEIEKLGYTVEDKNDETRVIKK